MKYIMMLFVFVLPTADASERFDTIVDIDSDFFSGTPKLPWGGDPFLRVPGYARVETKDEPLLLNGIVYSKGSPIAMINGKPVRQGEIVGGRLVSVIGDNFVILKKGASEIELNLPPLLEDEQDEDEEVERMPAGVNK